MYSDNFFRYKINRTQNKRERSDEDFNWNLCGEARGRNCKWTWWIYKIVSLCPSYKSFLEYNLCKKSKRDRFKTAFQEISVIFIVRLWSNLWWIFLGITKVCLYRDVPILGGPHLAVCATTRRKQKYLDF